MVNYMVSNHFYENHVWPNPRKFLTASNPFSHGCGISGMWQKSIPRFPYTLLLVVSHSFSACHGMVLQKQVDLQIAEGLFPIALWMVSNSPWAPFGSLCESVSEATDFWGSRPEKIEVTSASTPAPTSISTSNEVVASDLGEGRKATASEGIVTAANQRLPEIPRDGGTYFLVIYAGPSCPSLD